MSKKLSSETYKYIALVALFIAVVTLSVFNCGVLAIILVVVYLSSGSIIDIYPPRSQMLSSIIIFICFFIITLPFYCNYIDPDAVAYITIAKRYAAGDFSRAVNGLWSPFSCWLVALFSKIFDDAIFFSFFVNALACICILVAAGFLFKRFKIDQKLFKWLMLILPVFLIFCNYYQTFDDLWQVFFLLCYLLIVTSANFIKSTGKWILCGIIGSLAYFAKAYSFYFILVHLLVTLFILAKQNNFSRKAIIKPFVTVVLVMLLIMSPWIYALHQKYGVWTLSTASSLNESWFLTGHKTYKAGITYLIPPPYNNSPCNWEDPYLNEGHLYKPWENPKFILIQAARSAIAILQTILGLLQLSVFLLPVFILTARNIFYKKNATLFYTNHRILIWASLILPLGYMLIHMEARYIWLLVFTGLIFGCIWLNKFKEQITSFQYKSLVTLFMLSFLVYPSYKMKDIYFKARHLNEINFTRCNLQGSSFTSNGNPNQMAVIALWHNMQYYTLDVPISHKDLLSEMRRYHINYYILYFDKNLRNNSMQFYDENNNPFQIVCSIPGMNIYGIYPK
jgi:hypothetical protein